MKKYLLLVLLCVLCLVPAMAQDATADATNQVVDVISGEGEGTTVIVEASETPVETPATNVLSISNIIAFLVGGVVTFAGVMGWLGTQARAALNDPAKMVLAEKLGDSIPADTARQLIEGLNNVAAFLKEATDRQPALLKPSPTSSVSSTGAGFDSTAPRLP